MSSNFYQGQDPNQNDQYSGYQGYYQQQQQAPQPGTGTYQPPSYGQQQQQQQQQQQYSAYQPPLNTATQAGSSASDPTSTSLSAKNEALLSYLFWWVTGLIFLFVERKNRFVRFHAAQSVITLGSAFIVYVIVSLLKAIPFIGGLIFGPIQSIVLVIALLLWAFLMFRAYKGAKTRIPIAADYAEILADKFMVRRSPKTKKAK